MQSKQEHKKRHQYLNKRKKISKNFKRKHGKQSIDVYKICSNN